MNDNCAYPQGGGFTIPLWTLQKIPRITDELIASEETFVFAKAYKAHLQPIFTTYQNKILAQTL
jgi:hypothetical protein